MRITALSDAQTAQTASFAIAHGDTQNKATQKQSLLVAFRPLVNEIYANPSLTPQQIADTGLAVHSSSATPVTPITPTNLVAKPFANGDVELSWARTGNPDSVIFSIQFSPDALDWEIAYVTSATRTTLGGYAPGVAGYFRIVAQAGDSIATASDPAVIYPPSAPVQLSEAA